MKGLLCLFVCFEFHFMQKQNAHRIALLTSMLICLQIVHVVCAVCSMLIRKFNTARNVFKLVQLMGEIMKLCSRLFTQTHKPKQNRAESEIANEIMHFQFYSFEI